MHPSPRPIWYALVVAVLTVGLIQAIPGSAARPQRGQVPSSSTESTNWGAEGETAIIDGASRGRRFDGVGALSAGGSSRLLYDYPARQRGQILDYLFKPGYGAALQMLKVEIGSDVNSTSGSELTHQRTNGEVDCGRGYEWWLMKQAKRRNPDITLSALAWGAPGWARGDDGTPDGGFYSQLTIGFYLSWLKCAERHGLHIDYLGGWNERGYDTQWYVRLARALDRHYPYVDVVAADDCCSAKLWRVADSMAEDRAFKEAVDVVGVHFACGHRSEYTDCASTPTARELGEPLWMSENAAGSRDVGAAPIARALNRMYIDARMSSYTSWSLISAWYANLPIADSGLMVAEWPWSGFYDVGKSIWANAHTTQFTEPGWHYLDTGSGRLDSGATYTSLVSPSGHDFSTIVEGMDIARPTTVRFDLENLPQAELQVWSSDLRSGTHKDGELFRHEGAITPRGGSYELEVEPGHLYSVSTRTDAGKGDALPSSDVHEQLELPYEEDFEGEGRSEELARYFSDVNGAFEIVSCGGGRAGRCYRQQTPEQPVTWNDSGFLPPTTVVGDPRWWGDYTARAKVLLDGADYAEVIGRVSSQVTGTENVVGGYHLRVGTDGWSLYSVDPGTRRRIELASGEAAIDPHEWHRVALRMRGDRLTALLDGTRIARVHDARHLQGNVALQTGKWGHAQFDDVGVTPTATAPRTIPKDQLSVQASSDHGFYQGDSLRASNAIDDRPETVWQTEFDPLARPPHTLTLDLHRPRQINGLLVRPRIDGSTTAMITDYRLQTSRDGKTFRTVASGTWSRSSSTKAVVLDRRRTARYVRLAAPAGGCGEDPASLSEVDVIARPGPSLTTTLPEDTGGPDDPRFDHVVPQSEMSATATSSYGPGYEACRAIDGGDPTTFWHTSPAATGPLPASLTLDLGREHDVNGLGYLPRQDGNANGTISDYNVYVSTDGTNFQKVVEAGTWPNGAARKYATWPAARARYLRLEATNGVADVASVADLEVAEQMSGGQDSDQR
ncbi:discoidin domain-containing protein [Nocardioidaceae bacterium SCSIO 66511]|nr:discoidin domain-containing protein [Nocardioidaceae bacterium SCSIO 66511]